MKNKLIKLGLLENLVNEIIDTYNIYMQTIKEYSKPQGIITLRENLDDIELHNKRLQRKLKKLTGMEKQLLNQYCYPDIFDINMSLIRLSIACKEVKKKKIRFSRKEPFLISFVVDLWKLLESHDIMVTKYKDNILCKILNTLFPESVKLRKHKKDESEAPEDLWAFNLLRQASKYINKSAN